MKLSLSTCVVLAFALWGGPAFAQFGKSKDPKKNKADAQEQASEVKARVSVSGYLYKEFSADALLPNRESSKNALLYTDLRGKVEAIRFKKTNWTLMVDFRLRLTKNTYTPPDSAMNTDETNNLSSENRGLAARGWLGGAESDVNELYAQYRAPRYFLTLGRQVMREVDATQIDGASWKYRAGSSWELGAFSGLYPNPFSRTFADDYGGDTTTFGQVPIAAGAWTGYRSARAFGNIGVGGIVQRGELTQDVNRVFLTYNGYTRATQKLNIYHYIVGDLTGPSGLRLMNAHVLGLVRVSTRLRLELGVAQMSTYAIQVYLRDYLETVPTPDANAPILNNINLARLGRLEVRGGLNYSMPSGWQLFGDLRYRRRDQIVAGFVADPIFVLQADNQLDVGVGARKRDLFADFDFGGYGALIQGDRTQSQHVRFELSRPFLDERLELQAEVGYSKYQDVCDRNPTSGLPTDPTCQGSSDGSTIRGGVNGSFRKDKHWLFVADYALSKNSSTRQMGPMRVPVPAITGHSLFFQAHYFF